MDSFYLNWFAYEAGSIRLERFYETVNALISKSVSPEEWLLEASWLPENDAVALNNFVEKLGLFEEKEIVLAKIIGTYKLEMCSSAQLIKLMEKYFIDDEYGGFDSSNKELDEIYDKYQAPKLMFGEKQLENEVIRFVENHT